jgi:hypothetical protein
MTNILDDLITNGIKNDPFLRLLLGLSFVSLLLVIIKRKIELLTTTFLMSKDMLVFRGAYFCQKLKNAFSVSKTIPIPAN